MTDNVLKIETVHQCNRCLGCETLHPLGTVIDLSDADLSRYSYIKFDFYTVFFREHSYVDSVCGRKAYDYSNGTLEFLLPGESLNWDAESNACPPKGWILAFHPDLIKGTSLGEHMKDYTFFSYREGEALHVSAREKQVIVECFQHIRREIQHDIDCFSKILISRNIELLLDYCRRFYERQFITRHTENEKVLQQLENLVHEYIREHRLKTSGVPSEDYCAGQLHLSSAYFVDLLKHETGMSAREYVQAKRVEAARDLVRHSDKTISQIADVLGFPNVRYFSLVFKKIVGCSPAEYRMPN